MLVTTHLQTPCSMRKISTPPLFKLLLLSIQLLASEQNLTDAPSYLNIFFIETKTELNYFFF